MPAILYESQQEIKPHFIFPLSPIDFYSLINHLKLCILFLVHHLKVHIFKLPCYKIFQVSTIHNTSIMYFAYSCIFKFVQSKKASSTIQLLTIVDCISQVEVEEVDNFQSRRVIRINYSSTILMVHRFRMNKESTLIAILTYIQKALELVTLISILNCC